MFVNEMLKKDKKKINYEVNNVYLELAGSNFGGSINYERLISDDWSIRIGGYPYVRTDSTANQYYRDTNQPLLGANIVCTASYLIGPGNHKLEIGGGFTCFIPALYGTGLGMLAGIIGYRFQPKGGGFLFRIAFTPLIFDNVTIFQGGGLGITPIGSKKSFQSSSSDIYSFPVLPWIGISLGGTF
jgi:hypothetical protein